MERTVAPASREGSLHAWVRALERTTPLARNPSVTLPVVVENLAERFGTAPALLSDGESFTYRALAERVRRYARWALAQGLADGGVVCLLMPNRPEYLAIWLGITRVGGVVALLNTHLTGDSLARAITIVSPRHIIVAAELQGAVTEILPRLDRTVQCWVHGQHDRRFPRIDEQVCGYSAERLGALECRPTSLADRALHIYTSGTTGMPKAANVSHFRLMQWTHWFAGMMDTQPTDRLYNCLPMYHSIGGVVAPGAALLGGGSVVLRPRFSATRFWDEVVEWDCTLFQYIGELCRYLVNSPPSPRERAHRLRLCCGNGLGADVWDEFARRFGIPQVLEFYAATESNVSLYNCDGKPGAIGHIPGFLAHRFPVALIQVDLDTGEPLRDAAGFCRPSAIDEVGEALGKIVDDGSTPGSRFEGYTDAEASARRILHDVFVPGDAWYRTGDLMRRDAHGYFSFVDRLGDSFRWKGENVSSTEVAQAITACPGVAEAVVYGVRVPGTDGRAGMVAIVATEQFDLTAFRRHLVERLPAYARPLFLRLRDRFESTATFRPRTRELVGDGYDPARIGDPLYVDDPASQSFVKLDPVAFEAIQAGQVFRRA